MMCGNFLQDFRALYAQKDTKNQIQDGCMSTWRPEGGLFFTIMCIPDPLVRGATVQIVHDQETGAQYYLQRPAWIPDLPVNTSLLGQFVIDVIDGTERPNLMVFDILRHDSQDMTGVAPGVRYKLLRSISEGFNVSIMTLQWVGEYGAVRAFIADNREFKRLPHGIKYALVLAQDPLSPLSPFT